MCKALVSAEIARRRRTDSRVFGREVVNDCKLGEKKNVNVPGCMQHLTLEECIESWKEIKCVVRF